MYYSTTWFGLILDQFSQMLKITSFLITINQEGLIWPMYNLLWKDSDINNKINCQQQNEGWKIKWIYTYHNFISRSVEKINNIDIL